MQDFELASLLGMDKGDDSPTLAWGKVTAVDSESVVANVMGASVAAVRCCDCSPGDVVALEGQKGRWRAIGRKGGRDASLNDTIENDRPRLYLKNKDADYSATDTATRYGALFFSDKNDSFYGYVQASRRTNGASWLEIDARSSTSGTQIDNPLRLIVNANGSREVYLDQPSWRSALGLSVTAGAATWSSPWTGTAYLRKQGNLVVLSFEGAHVTTSTTLGTTSFTNNKVMTLPDGLRPAIPSYGFCGGNSTSRQAVLYVATDGGVYLAYPNSTTAPTSNGFYGSIAFFAS